MLGSDFLLGYLNSKIDSSSEIDTSMNQPRKLVALGKRVQKSAILQQTAGPKTQLLLMHEAPVCSCFEASTEELEVIILSGHGLQSDTCAFRLFILN